MPKRCLTIHYIGFSCMSFQPHAETPLGIDAAGRFVTQQFAHRL